MTTSYSLLVDVNVWLAFLTKEHEHHLPSRRWLDSLLPGDAGICRATQLSLLRLLCNRTIMSHGVLSATEAWNRVAQLLEDIRVEFVLEPPEIERVFPSLLDDPIPTSKLINDAYLAALAIRSNRSLVTWDRGFRQFPGLSVTLLEP